MDCRQGVYGWDKLSKFLLIMGFLFALGRSVFGIIAGLSIAIYAFWRTRSKNLMKRTQEEMAFENLERSFQYWIYRVKHKKIWYNLKKRIRDVRSEANERRHFKITRCPKCSQKLRLPRHKGRIVVTCPKCCENFKFRT